MQGRWTSTQLPWHINLKEILAAKFSLETLMKDVDIITLHMDSQVAVLILNKMGGHQIQNTIHARGMEASVIKERIGEGILDTRTKSCDGLVRWDIDKARYSLVVFFWDKT